MYCTFTLCRSFCMRWHDCTFLLKVAIQSLFDSFLTVKMNGAYILHLCTGLCERCCLPSVSLFLHFMSSLNLYERLFFRRLSTNCKRSRHRRIKHVDLSLLSSMGPSVVSELTVILYDFIQIGGKWM